MRWREVTRMSLREEFVKLAKQPGANRRELCRRFGASRRRPATSGLSVTRPRAAAVLRTARAGHGARPNAVLIIRRPRARTSASIARSSSSACATSTSPAWSTASASSMPFATATTCAVRTTRSASILRSPVIVLVRFPFPSRCRPSSILMTSRCAGFKPKDGSANHGRLFRVSKALRGWPVALRQSELGDSLREVLFCHQTITTIDLDPPSSLIQ